MRQDRIRNTIIREIFEGASIVNNMVMSQLRWFRHTWG